ncbi:GumC family protein [Tateyamaria sp.]|uniref:GumC family protein n=1 Tax=Tateyamaria sp. TaxID=1929288 RepID=UPI00329BD2F5
MEVSRSIGSIARPQNAPEPHYQDDDTIDLSEILATLWRGKWIISVFVMAAVFIGAYYAFAIAVPKYRSTAVVILETKQDQIVDLQSVVGGISGDTSELNSELQVLRSRGLIGKVVDRLDLMQDPEFNASLRPISFQGRLNAEARAAAKLFLSKVGIKSTPPSETDAPQDDLDQRRRDSVISSVLRAVDVNNIRQSLVFQINVETENAQKSALIADTIAELYILNQIEVKFESMEQATNWLSERVVLLQATLEENESKVSEFSASTQLVSVEGLRALERQIKELRERIETAKAASDTLRKRLEDLEAAENRADRAEVANDDQLTRLLPRVETDEAIMRAFDARFEIVLQRARLDLLRSEQQLVALENSETELARQVARQGEDLIALQQLSREAEATRVLYEYFLTRLNETSAQQGIQRADSRVLSKAVVPGGASEPRKSRIVALSAILGFMLGAGLVLLREMRDNGFRTAKDLEAATGYTVVGQIPIIPARKRQAVLKYLSEKPTSSAAEAVRNLRTSLMLSNVDNPPKVIVSTSSVPGEGKTTTSIALAQNLVGMGKKVLLIEGDIRRRTLGEYFPDLPKCGIVSVLAGDLSLGDAVHHSSSLGTDVLGSEKSAVNAADLFASDKFKELIQEARKLYDAIIIDTPPVLVVPDVRIISDVSDAVLFSVKWDKTSKHQVEESLRLFHSSDQRLAGMVLTQISERGMKRYGYGGRYGAYAKYGSKYYTN